MAQTTVSVRTLRDAPMAMGWAGHRTLTIDRPEEAGGRGLAYSGGELLLLALGACYTNDIFREALTRGIAVRSVSVDVHADCGLAYSPLRAQRVARRSCWCSRAAP